jgi:hypothetical protein
MYIFYIEMEGTTKLTSYMCYDEPSFTAVRKTIHSVVISGSVAVFIV